MSSQETIETKPAKSRKPRKPREPKLVLPWEEERILILQRIQRLRDKIDPKMIFCTYREYAALSNRTEHAIRTAACTHRLAVPVIKQGHSARICLADILNELDGKNS